MNNKQKDLRGTENFYSANNRFQTVSDVLSPFKSVYFDPMRGNNGDRLIRLGSQKMLQTLRIDVRPSLADTDVVVMNGGGGMTSTWGALSVIQSHITRGAKTVIVLPTSFHVPVSELESLRALAMKHRCRLVLFAREKRSFNRLAGVFRISDDLFLADDMALYLSKGDILALARRTRQPRPYSLVVERQDAESSTGFAAADPATAFAASAVRNIPFKEMVPLGWKRRFWRLQERRILERTEFFARCKHSLSRLPGHGVVVGGDVSNSKTFTFSQFARLVTEAKYVVTTRLHVAILRHIIGRPCFLVATGGDYQKNESIYEYSLSQAPYVSLLPGRGDIPDSPLAEWKR